jgi:hypothetical protein
VIKRHGRISVTALLLAFFRGRRRAWILFDTFQQRRRFEQGAFGALHASVNLSAHRIVGEMEVELLSKDPIVMGPLGSLALGRLTHRSATGTIG